MDEISFFLENYDTNSAVCSFFLFLTLLLCLIETLNDVRPHLKITILDIHMYGLSM